MFGGTSWLPLLLLVRKRYNCVSDGHRGKCCRNFSFMVVSQTGLKMWVNCLLCLTLLLNNFVRTKSEVRSSHSNCLGLSLFICGGSYLLIISYWIIVLRFILHQICMYCHLCPWYVLILSYFRFISLKFMTRVVTLWYQMRLQDRTQLLFNLLWCLLVGNWSSLWFNTLDDSMDIVGRECLWTLTVCFSSQLVRFLFG